MNDFDERARRAADAIRQEAAQITDTESALARTLAGETNLALVGNRGRHRWLRRRSTAFAAMAVGSAAALLAFGAIVLGDREAGVIDNATTPGTTTPDTATEITSPISDVTSPGSAVTVPTDGSTASSNGAAGPITADPQPTAASSAVPSVGQNTTTQPAPATEPTPLTEPNVATTTEPPRSPVTAPEQTSTSAATTQPPVTNPPVDRTTTTTTTTTTSPPAAPTWTPSQPAEPAPPSLDQVVRLVPGELDEGDELARFEPSRTSQSPTGAYVQVFSTADGSGWLYVETYVPPSMYTDEPTTSTIGPWAVVEPSVGAMLALRTDDIEVALSSNVVDMAEARTIAGQLRPREGGAAPGWDVGALPAGLTAVTGQYWYPWTARSVLVSDQGYPVITVDVVLGSPHALAPEYDPHQVVDLDGKRAIYASNEGVSSLTWEYEAGVVVILQMEGGVGADAMRAQARALRELSPSEWEAMPVASDGDGCQKFVC